MPNSLRIALHNDSDTDQLFAYITGLAIQQGARRCFLRPDGSTLYFPSGPPRIGTPLAEDCAIPLGAPGNSVTVTIPQIAGGRIWVSRGPKKLTFLLNPAGGGAAALVEPSVLNPSDPNRDVDFGFAEFTLDGAQIYANVSFVDFVPRVPIGLLLHCGPRGGTVQRVAGTAPDGVERLAEKLREQAAADGWPWDKLIVHERGTQTVLRVLSPTHGDAAGARFAGYFEAYVDAVLRHYAPAHQGGGGATLHIDTQAGPGVVSGTADLSSSGRFTIGGEPFGRPTTADILGCNSGPFTTGPSPLRNAVIPRLAAAFARSALLETARHPSGPETFYRFRGPGRGGGGGEVVVTNHYARLVHEVAVVDGRGYAFAYDDVQPGGGEDQSGKVNAGDPVLLTVSVGESAQL
ncbi:hypothetical protein SLS62_001713 [Diatrype stigma]|uniref:GH64 domain-containing protein n=1 Tax=Diatrype stigma TaxID=117547 RepID=A0AAN9UYW2_9PEZI